ncbi:MAG: hypothetical protein WA970_03150 [Gammaproteobacteria bacterium]
MGNIICLILGLIDSVIHFFARFFNGSLVPVATTNAPAVTGTTGSSNCKVDMDSPRVTKLIGKNKTNLVNPCCIVIISKRIKKTAHLIENFTPVKGQYAQTPEATQPGQQTLVFARQYKTRHLDEDEIRLMYVYASPYSAFTPINWVWNAPCQSRS